VAALLECGMERVLPTLAPCARARRALRRRRCGFGRRRGGRGFAGDFSDGLLGLFHGSGTSAISSFRSFSAASSVDFAVIFLSPSAVPQGSGSGAVFPTPVKSL